MKIMWFLFQNGWNTGVTTTSLTYVMISIFELNHVHDFSDYRVDGQNCLLKFGTMNKLRWFVNQNERQHIELYAEHLLALTDKSPTKHPSSDPYGQGSNWKSPTSSPRA